ncbi:hypothetical protein [Desulfonema magnum]|uniref:Uncharacterized protein n=1 Tax=Desulfonema magnum TaxID=45655 RepID=A0A975GM13_9BACT|nr:hypothetical protein [Desulfonema magnum]QTA86426.1 Uncharacterized protein dnm_024500 [Desulfonema magnum]
MPYTMEDYRRDYLLEHMHKLPPEERLKGLSSEDLLKRLSKNDLLKGLSKNDLLKSVKERLTPEEIEACLKELRQQK